MEKTKKIVSVLVAAGSSSRLGGGISKPYKPLEPLDGGQQGEAPLLTAARGLAPYGALQVVIRGQDRALYEETIATAPELDFLPAVEGGATRAASVLAGLEGLAAQKPDIVLIHDGARPFIPDGCVELLLAALEAGFDAAAPALPLTDNLKQVEGGIVRQFSAPPPLPPLPQPLFRVQTPQIFIYQQLKEAFASATLTERDELVLIEKAGGKIKLIGGDPRNIKLTNPEDYTPFLPTRTGFGVDSHRFGAGNFIMLGGIKIEHDCGIEAHSDGDVVIHALCDALLGAIAAGDLGTHFPATEEWRDAPSRKMLEQVINLVQKNNFTCTHIDITIICQSLRIAPHRERLRESLAALVGLPLSATSIKATTTDGLGLIGEGKGLAATASVQVRSLW